MEDVDSFRSLVVAPGVAVSGGWGVLCSQSLFLAAFVWRSVCEVLRCKQTAAKTKLLSARCALRGGQSG